MPERLEVRARKAITEKVFPGCVIGIVRGNGERSVAAFGRLTYDEGSDDVREDTIYDIASVTKSIPTASLAAMFVAESKLKLEDEVKTYIPELQNDFGATVEDLLRYRVHGPQMSALKYPTFEQIRTRIFEKGFDGPPGESEYMNLPAFLLGIILERVGGAILPALAETYFFGPLKMTDTTFFPALPAGRPHAIGNIAPTEVIEGREIRGTVHDESARMFALKRRAVGHAGLFSTVPDLLNFVEALLRGEFSPVLGCARRGLGWQLEGQLLGRVEQGEPLPARRFGKTGFTGTSVVVDVDQAVGLVILSNRTYPKRASDQNAINALRGDIADILFS